MMILIGTGLLLSPLRSSSSESKLPSSVKRIDCLTYADLGASRGRYGQVFLGSCSLGNQILMAHGGVMTIKLWQSRQIIGGVMKKNIAYGFYMQLWLTRIG
jgi:hypothetical protein